MSAISLPAVLLVVLAAVAAPSASQEASSRVEERVLQLANAARERHGLAPLQPLPALTELARSHSRQMATGGFLAHTDSSGRTFADRIRASGVAFRQIGENIAMNEGVPEPAATAVEGWLKSPPHRENLLNPAFTHTGVGVWSAGDRYYFTQVFLAPPDGARPGAPSPP
jgi:uncharacterized protein YkwD